MTDTSILRAAMELISADNATYGDPVANVKARVALHAEVDRLIIAHSTPTEMGLVARDLADLVVAAITGADRSKVCARAIADLAKISPEIGVQSKLDTLGGTTTSIQGRTPMTTVNNIKPAVEPKEIA